jgi:hypothetical protein
MGGVATARPSTAWISPRSWRLSTTPYALILGGLIGAWTGNEARHDRQKGALHGLQPAIRAPFANLGKMDPFGLN